MFEAPLSELGGTTLADLDAVLGLRTQPPKAITRVFFTGAGRTLHGRAEYREDTARTVDLAEPQNASMFLEVASFFQRDAHRTPIFTHHL